MVPVETKGRGLRPELQATGSDGSRCLCDTASLCNHPFIYSAVTALHPPDPPIGRCLCCVAGTLLSFSHSLSLALSLSLSSRLAGSQLTRSLCRGMEKNKGNPYASYDPRPPPYNTAVYGQSDSTGVSYQVSGGFAHSTMAATTPQ